MAAELVGKSGTMMAAVLESAGYLFQARILAEMQSAFEGSLGAFIFLIGLVVALTHLAVKGSFKLAPWLLFGPPMFFAVIYPKTGIPEAQWKFGQQDRSQAKVVRELYTLTGSSGEAQVSKLFARYVQLISESVQEIVKRINRLGRDSDRTLIFRGDMLTQIYQSRADDTPFWAFLHEMFFYGCREMIDAAALVENPEFGPTETREARRLLGPGYEDFRTYAGVVITKNAASFIQSLQGTVAGEYDEMARNMNRRVGERLTCEQVWNLTRIGLLRIGVRRIAEIQRRAGANNVDTNQLMRDLDRSLFGPQSSTNDARAMTSRLQSVVARYVLRNEITTQGFTGLMLRNRSDLGVNASVEIVDDYDLHRVEQARVSTMEWSEKTRMMSAAENLPYYQGLLLYFLGLSFPFFALMLLVPGKHSGFILWFVLWLWVKSWDIGIAVVALLDQLIFTLLSFHREVRTLPHQSEQLPEAFGLAMMALKNMDPTFQLSTYYNILATCLLSIPVISSQLILGSLSGGAGLVASGMGMAAQTLAGAAQTAQQQTAVSELRFRLNDLKRARADGLNDVMWNRRPLTPDQRARFFEAGVNRTAAGDAYRADVMEFGSAADRIQRAGAQAPELRRQLRSGQTGRGVDGAPLPTPFAGPQAGTARRFAYPTNFTVHRIVDNPSHFEAQLRSFDEIVNNMQRSAGLYGAMSAASNYGDVDWMAGVGPRAASRLAVVNTMRWAFQGLGAGRAFQLANLQNAADELNIDGQVLYQWLMFNQTYSAQGQDLAGLARVYGMLEVPWTENSGSEKDDQYMQFLRRRQVSTELASLQTILQIIEQGANPSTIPQWADIVRDVAAFADNPSNGLSDVQRQRMYSAMNDPVIQNFFRRPGADAGNVDWWLVDETNRTGPMLASPTPLGMFRSLFGTPPASTRPGFFPAPPAPPR